MPSCRWGKEIPHRAWFFEEQLTFNIEHEENTDAFHPCSLVQMCFSILISTMTRLFSKGSSALMRKQRRPEGVPRYGHTTV